MGRTHVVVASLAVATCAAAYSLAGSFFESADPTPPIETPRKLEDSEGGREPAPLVRVDVAVPAVSEPGVEGGPLDERTPVTFDRLPGALASGMEKDFRGIMRRLSASQLEVSWPSGDPLISVDGARHLRDLYHQQKQVAGMIRTQYDMALMDAEDAGVGDVFEMPSGSHKHIDAIKRNEFDGVTFSEGDHLLTTTQGGKFFIRHVRVGQVPGLDEKRVAFRSAEEAMSSIMAKAIATYVTFRAN